MATKPRDGARSAHRTHNPYVLPPPTPVHEQAMLEERSFFASYTPTTKKAGSNSFDRPPSAMRPDVMTPLARHSSAGSPIMDEAALEASITHTPYFGPAATAASQLDGRAMSLVVGRGGSHIYKNVTVQVMRSPVNLGDSASSAPRTNPQRVRRPQTSMSSRVSAQPACDVRSGRRTAVAPMMPEDRTPSRRLELRDSDTPATRPRPTTAASLGCSPPVLDDGPPAAGTDVQLQPPKDLDETRAAQQYLVNEFHEDPAKFEIPHVPLPADRLCTDPAIVAQRERQIEIGRKRPEYVRYLSLVPKAMREAGNPDHPLTPRAACQSTCRRFKTLMHRWRRVLHLYGDEAFTGRPLGTLPKVYDPAQFAPATPTPDGSPMPDANADLVEGVEKDASPIPGAEADMSDTFAPCTPRDGAISRDETPCTPRNQLGTTPRNPRKQTPLYRPTPRKPDGSAAPSSSAPGSPFGSNLLALPQ